MVIVPVNQITPQNMEKMEFNSFVGRFSSHGIGLAAKTTLF
jgi:hypothetical protein